IQGQFDKLPQYYDPHFVQHNPLVPDGLDGLAKGVEAMTKQGMSIHFEKVHRILGEGNFVLAHSEGKLGNKPAAFFDLFRVENGKIAEHWDVIQEILAGAKNNNGMF